jgi:DNA polymerase-3 subunit epsilon
MKAIAIDFETANETRASACSVGLAFIEDGQVVRVEERLIRPPGMRFSPFNVAIHGIRPQDVEHAPEFPDVLAEFAEDFSGAAMVAHNASFDFSVMRASLDLYDLPYPELSYVCSVKLAQRHWPDLGSHRLNSVAAHLGFRFNHHNAAEDARVCALSVLAIADRTGAQDLIDLARIIGVRPGRLHAGGYEACSFVSTAKQRKLASTTALQG